MDGGPTDRRTDTVTRWYVTKKEKNKVKKDTAFMIKVALFTDVDAITDALPLPSAFLDVSKKLAKKGKQIPENWNKAGKSR